MRIHALGLALSLSFGIGCSGGSGGGGHGDTCAPPATACGDACVSLDTDVSNCGACGHACGAGLVCTGGACAAPACDAVRLPGPPLPRGLGTVWKTVAADLDGDELADLVVGGHDDQGNGIFLLSGRGDGTFAAPVALHRAGPTADLHVANLDGAGLPDVVVTGSAPGEEDGVTVLSRDLAGTVRAEHHGWRMVYGLAVGDLDGDGDLDVIACAVTGVDTSALRVLRNDDGAFTWNGPEVPVAGRGSDPILGDRDGDGDLDLFGPGEGTGAGWWENQGNLVFALRWTAPIAGLSVLDTLRFAQADLDGDGDLDVVTFGPTILRNEGGGAPPSIEPLDLGGAATDVQLADVDADGDLDLYAVVRAPPVTTLRIARNQGGHFLPADRFGAAWGAELAVADLDRDGTPDAILSQRQGGAIEVLPGEGGTLRGRCYLGATAGDTNWLALADLDGHGSLAAITVGGDSLGELVLAGPAWRDWDVTGARGLAVGDLDGDGRADLVTAQPDTDRLVLVPSAGVATTVEVGDSPQAVAFGDVDGDGLTDLLVVEEQPHPTLHVRWGRGFAGDSYYWLAESPGDVVAGDLDGDGRDEVAIATRTWLQVVRYDDGGNLASAGLYDVWTLAPSIVDLDGDGKAELLAPARMSPQVLVLRLEGGGPVLADTVVTEAPPVTTAAADLDGDGRLDLAVADQRGYVEVFRGSGTTFTPIGTWLGDGDATTIPTREAALAAADVDGDGRADLAWLGPDGLYVLPAGCAR